MKPATKHLLVALGLLALCGCASSPQASHRAPDLNPAHAKAVDSSELMVDSRGADTLVVIPPPNPLEILIPWPCTNCYAQLQESFDLQTWWTHDELYYLTPEGEGEHYINAGLTNQQGFFRLLEVTNL